MSDESEHHRSAILEQIDFYRVACPRIAELSSDANPLAIVATEDFVKRTQIMLSRRARQYLAAGTLCTFLSIAALGGAALYLYTSTLPHQIDGSVPIDTRVVVMFGIRYSAAATFIIGAAAFLASLARSFFHESTVLHSKRHALTFGWLAVYVRGGNLSQDDLESAFKWNEDFHTAFRRPPKTPIGKAAEFPSEFIKALKGLGGKDSLADNPPSLK